MISGLCMAKSVSAFTKIDFDCGLKVRCLNLSPAQIVTK